MQKAILVSVLMMAVTLAGCADEPPSGEFSATTPAMFAESATATLTVTPATNTYPVNDPTGAGEECQIDAVTGEDPTGTAPACTDASSSISGDFQGLVASATGYALYLVSAEDEFDLGDLELMEGMESHWQISEDFPGEDLSGYDMMELRDGDVVVARAGATGGSFELAAELDMFSADVSYSGKEITVMSMNAPEGVQLVAWLVSVDEESGEMVHDKQFILAGNETVFEADMNIGSYAAFHVHVGNSKVNIAVADII